MSFPAYLHLGSLVVHPHWIFESLAYTAGFYLYRRLRRQNGDVIDSRARWWVIIAAMIGGFAGSRFLSAFEDPVFLADHWLQPRLFLGGKTIVGGLVGGLIAVESVKRLRGIRVATGDLLALAARARASRSDGLAAFSPASKTSPTELRRGCRGAWISATGSPGIPRSCTKSSFLAGLGAMLIVRRAA